MVARLGGGVATPLTAAPTGAGTGTIAASDRTTALRESRSPASDWADAIAVADAVGAADVIRAATAEVVLDETTERDGPTTERPVEATDLEAAPPLPGAEVVESATALDVSLAEVPSAWAAPAPVSARPTPSAPAPSHA